MIHCFRPSSLFVEAAVSEQMPFGSPLEAFCLVSGNFRYESSLPLDTSFSEGLMALFSYLVEGTFHDYPEF